MLELDLNVDATFSKEPVTDAITVVYMEDCSPTSSSSVIVNTVSGATEEDSDSTATYTAQPTSFFAFDILNKPQEHSFQLTGAGKTSTGDGPSEPGSGRFSSAQAQPHWLNLSYAEPLVEKAPSELSVMQQKQQLPVTAKKSRRGPRSRSSQYRGVTFYRRTGRWESHIWDCGKQVYLGGFDTAHAAARAYDRAAIKFRGVDADINFNLSDYEEDMKQTKNLGKEEFVHVLRRQSTGFARGSSKYRAVTLQKCGRLEARMGQLLGKNAYDAATVRCNEIGVLTDFKPAAHDRGLTWGANNQGSVHNLDLSIGISSSSVDSKNNDNRGNINFACAAIEMPKREMPLLASAPSAPVYGQLTSHGLAMASRNISVWPAILPSSYVPKHEDGGRKDRIVEAISLPKFPNWAWQMQQGHGHGSIFSTAASSGFSSSVPPSSVSSTALPLHNQHTASHYYSHIE